MFRVFLITSSIVLSALVAQAKDAPPRKIDLSKEDASVEFLAKVKPGSISINGTGAKINGNLEIEHDSLTGELVVRLEELKTGIGLRDQHMKEKFLETNKYPEAKLKISEMKLTKDPFTNAAKQTAIPFKGTLTVHGSESKIEGTADIDSTGSQIIAEVKTATTIPAHKIEKPSYLGVKVADEIEVSAHLKLKKL